MKDAARLFRALGDETRLALLAELQGGGRTVGELTVALGVPQPNVSRHLKTLKEVGLVEDHKEGRHVRYRRAVPGPLGEEIRRWLEAPGRRTSPRTLRRPDDLDTHLL